MADIITVKNTSDTPFVGKYNNRPFTIPANGSAIVDREAAIIWFGNWEARNIGTEERNQFRWEEWRRLRGLYGAHFDDRMGDPKLEKPMLADEKWENNKPKVELYTTDGTRIIGVIEDPEGSDLPLEDAPVENLSAAMAEMQRQITDMQSRLMAAQEATSSIGIPEDDPSQAPRRKRGPVTVDATAREETG